MALTVDPSTLSPSGLWKADALSGADGSLVATWADSSGNGRDLTQATGSLKPLLRLWQLNNLPSVRFDGTDDFLAAAVNLSTLLGTDGLGTIIAVVRCFDVNNPDSTPRGIWGVNAATGTKATLRLDSAPQAFEAINYDGSSDAATIVMPDDTISQSAGPHVRNVIDFAPRIVVWQHDTSGAVVLLGVDNLDAAALVSAATGATSDLANTLLVGRTFEDYWKGDIFEVIAFPTLLSEADRRAVCLWLTQKYALPYESGIASEAGASATMAVEMKLPSTVLNVAGVDSITSRPEPGPTLHLKADAITGLNDGDPVSTWEDSSGNGRDVTQTGANRPLYKTGIINGLPAILFDGTDDFLSATATLADILGFDGWGMIYAVMRADRAGAAQTHTLWQSSSGSTHLVADENGSDVVQASNDDGAQDSAAEAYVFGNWGMPFWMHALGGGNLEGTPTNIIVGLDESGNLTAVASGATAAAELALVFDIGGNTTVGDLFKGYIAELIVFPRAHNGAQRRQVLSYLAAKYNLTYEASEFEPIWTDVTQDAVRSSRGLSFRSGMDGAEAKDRVASGELQFVLENSAEAPSGVGIEGYYSPEHANVRTGFRIGTPVRVGFTHYGTTYYKWQGWITNLRVVPGQDKERAVAVTAGDWLDFAGRITLSNLPIRTAERADQLMFRLYANSPRIPESYHFSKGSDVYAYAFDNTEDEGILILAELYRLTISELGYTYMRGDTLGGGRLRFESRDVRTGSVVRWALADAQIEALELSDHGLDGVINRVLVELHPRRVDAAATTVLFSLGNTPQILSGESATFVAPYRDPDGGRFVRVGGTAMVTPVATTDFTANSQADGGGSDLTGNFTVTPTFGGNAAKLVVANSGADGYLTKCQLRGKGVYAFETVVIDVKDSASIALYGQMSQRIDMPYQDDVNLADTVAALLLANNSVPRTKVKRVGFTAETTSAAMMHALAREIGDRITITEQVSGLAAAEYFIQGIQFDVIGGPVIRASWLLVPADQEDYS